jgi:hypothetical protein
MKINYWLDSGANAHSTRRGSVTLDEIGLSEEEWFKLTDKEKEDIMSDYIFEGAEWGFEREEDL